MTSSVPQRADAIIIGGGITGIVTALRLLEAGKRVLLLDRGSEQNLGGLAMQAFGGMALVDTPLQRLNGIRDSADIALADWYSFAEFGADDLWPRRWAEHYVTRCVPEVYEWLRHYGLHFIPSVQWVERGGLRRGNTLPRYHVLWGTSQRMTTTLLRALRDHPRRQALQILCGHTVHELMLRDRHVVGCAGIDATSGAPFEAQAEHVVIASGGITGDLAKVRANWPRDWGAPPQTLLNGSHPPADGMLHEAVAAIDGRVTHLEQMWNYAAGVHHPRPQFPQHGLSLIPCKSALWMDHRGRRIGPEPLVTCYDTHAMVEQIARRQYPYTWQILNRRIAVRELAASGAEHNPLIRDRRAFAFALQLLRGNRELVDELTRECEDFVVASNLPNLARRMNTLAGNDWISPDVLESEIQPYDEQIARGRRFHNDEQLRRIAHLRQWTGDRLRTCAFQRILDPDAGPLIAIREFILTRKSMGGIQTDLGSRVLDTSGQPIPGLLAAGEAAGFGGGGANGKRSLEGTFLSGCILTAQTAARTIASTA